MIDKAKKKINNEMEKENNQYVKVIGEYLLEQIDNNPAAAEKVLAEDKTIMGSLKAMEKEAHEHKVGNVGVITPDHGFAIVADYFGLSSAGHDKKEEKSAVDFDIELDDLLD